MSVSRDDLEAKLREIEGAVIETEDEARENMAVIIGGVVAVAVVLVAFGIWRSRRRRIHVEVYRTL
jgi:uncharacterized membrane protein YccC